MFELRFHGRGGQGAVTSAEILALAAIRQGKFAQAFPSFGPERRGASVIAYARIGDRQIRNRTAVTEPNAVLVLDPSIMRIVDTSRGIVEGGFQVVNSKKGLDEVREEYGLKGRLAVVDANHIAMEEMGRVITNTTMLGALLRATGVVDRDLVVVEIENRFGRLAESNIKAFDRAFAECAVEE